ncbi:MSMEG_6728 family protein [Nakamurella flavida]|uniref:MSMEG_6728 family protein n=1 Tax=Nakamurella flavida TaxID=363630 RepID=A0A938YNI6_9ACTN|nr:MSMEG_6728 family protein [Nakamurella flavida]MBM9476479.1 MSMEG_6728 family protein [Nakamurella flavida]MDP9779085.1 hypothetical protein [Nakamurella flavida]
MQTFLPYPDFRASAEALDSPRLGKQRVETLQILRALELPEYGWRTHPAVVMWRGRTPALVVYGLVTAQVWTERGFGDSTAAQILEFAPDMAGVDQAGLAARGLLPSWVGDEALHRSHRGKLLAKDPAFYAAFADDPGLPDDLAGLEYVWPPADAGLPEVPGAVGEPLWVVRADSPTTLAAQLAGGFVGLGAETGVLVDASGRDLDGVRDLVEGGRPRRPKRPLIGLAALLALPLGDPVAVPEDGGTTLRLGTVSGPYRHVPDDPAGLIHQVPVRWAQTVPRTAIVPSGAMQDVRPVFEVLVGPSAVVTTE